MIRELRKSDALAAARIHYNNFENAFFCELGEKFMQIIYEEIASSDQAFGFVFEDEEGIRGFVTGTYDADNFFSSIYKKRFMDLGISVGKAILRKPLLISKVMQTLFYSKNESNIKAELISIAVDKKARKKGLGRKLFLSLVDKYKHKNIRGFKLIVDKDNKEANIFYKNIGFVKDKAFEMYGKEINQLIYEIK